MNKTGLVNYRFLAVALLLSFSASSYPESPLDIPKLGTGYGYLVLDTETEIAVSEWRLSKRVAFDSLPDGRSVRLVPLRAGNYQWQSISAPLYDLPYRLDLSENDYWAFRIEAKKINYIGSLLVGEIRSSNTIDVRLVNRSVMTYEYLKADQPELLQEYPFVYSGYYQDDFGDLIRAENGSQTE